MRHEFHALNVPTSAGNGTPQLCQDFEEKAVQFIVATGSFKLEGSNDGAAWCSVPNGSAVSADGFVTVPFAVKYVRVVTVTPGSGAEKVILGGMLSRSF